MKKTLSLVLALVLCLALAVPALAIDVAVQVQGGTIYLNPENGWINDSDKENIVEIVIPEEIEGIEIVRLGDTAFYGSKKLERVVLPETLTVIGGQPSWGAFYGCKKLTKIYIPASVTTIGMDAFKGCENLTDIYYGGNLGQWGRINVSDASQTGGNSVLVTATIHYNASPEDVINAATPETPAHNLTYFAAKAATCTEPGNLEYWYCTDCGKYFSDAEATVETTLEAVTIAALGHNYVNGVCTRDGAIDPNYTAPTPDPEPEPEPEPSQNPVTPPSSDEIHTHSLAYTAAKAATCTEGGNLEYWYCAGCGKYFSDGNGVNEITLARITLNALGHNYVDGVCTRCGELEPGYVNPLTPSNVHFQKSTLYYQGQFEDVPANQWYTNSVAEAVELGLMKGNGDGSFNPSGDVTLAEAITMAARIHSIYTTGKDEFGTGSPWWQPYLDYAYNHGVISWAYYNADVTQKATRAQFAEIFANALPAEALTVINRVADDAIPDVPLSAAYAEYVYKLYRAGILVGSDANGTFYAQTYITRAEAAAIVSRMAESNNRVSLTLG